MVRRDEDVDGVRGNLLDDLGRISRPCAPELKMVKIGQNGGLTDVNWAPALCAPRVGRRAYRRALFDAPCDVS